MLDSLIAQALLPLFIVVVPVAGAVAMVAHLSGARGTAVSGAQSAAAAQSMGGRAAAADGESVRGSLGVRSPITMSHLRSVPAAMLLALSVSTVIALQLGWSISLVPLMLAPVVAAWFGMSLRDAGVAPARAQVYAWTGLVAPSIVWSAAVLVQVDSLGWGQLGYGGVRISWGEWSLVGGRTWLAVGTAGALLLAAASSVAAARGASGSVSGGFALASVPFLAQIWLTVPLGVVVSAWTLAVIGYALARGQAPAGTARGADGGVLAGASAVVGGPMAGIGGMMRSPVLHQVALLATLSFGMGSVFRALPPESVVAAVGPWVAVAGVGGYGYRWLRRVHGAADAMWLTTASQLIALVALTVVWGSIWLLENGVDFTSEGVTGAYALVLLEMVALGLAMIGCVGYVVAAGELARHGTLVVGVAWPVVLVYCLNVHGIEPSGTAWVFDWEASQVWSTVIGMTAGVAAMWWGMGLTRDGRSRLSEGPARGAARLQGASEA